MTYDSWSLHLHFVAFDYPFCLQGTTCGYTPAMAVDPYDEKSTSGKVPAPPPTLPKEYSLKQIWQTLKEYFGDGYVPGSAPLRFRVHICETAKPAPTDNLFFGVHIDEDAMPLFGPLGAATKPPCTCADMAAVVRRMDSFIDAALPSDHAADAYGIYSRKDDASAEDTCVYAMRDVVQWWVHWHGPLDRAHHYWKQIYVGFSTIADDLLIPPQHLADGTFRFLGHTVHDVLAGLQHAEGLSAADCEWLYMSLLREFVLQYLEKVDPGLRELLLERTVVMSQFRTISANTPGGAVALLAARGLPLLGGDDEASLDEVVEMAAYGDALSMDMTKEALGVLQGEPTETVAGADRGLLNAELRWTYARCIGILDSHDGGKYVRRYATSGMHFVPTMDRYQERFSLKRRKLTVPMQEMVANYTVGCSVPNREVAL